MKAADEEFPQPDLSDTDVNSETNLNLDSGQELMVHNFESEVMQNLMKQARRVSDMNVPVLICGESGSGKKYLARLIQPEREQVAPFIAINCLKYSEEYSGGAGDAEEREAAFRKVLHEQLREARGGTLYVDRVDKLNRSLQNILFCVLLDQEYENTGGQGIRYLYSSTVYPELLGIHENFNMELLNRINVVTLEIPPLRDHVEDIPLMCAFFLKEFQKNYHLVKRLTPDCQALLRVYSWPGNVRELRNVLLRAAIRSQGDIINTQDLSHLKKSQGASELDLNLQRGFSDLVSEYEKKILESALFACEWNQSRASRLLQMNRGTLIKKMKIYNLLGA